jgi:uncharacterized surface anchored protein
MKQILARTGKRRRLAQVGIIFTAIALLALIVVPAAFAVLPGSPSSFESGNDPTLGLGNMTVETATPDNTDWVSVTGEADYLHLTDVAAKTTDDSFTPGQKQDTTCPTIEGHKNPPKDDFTDVASFTEVASGGAHDGETYLYGATLRYTANGNASENIELKQSDELCPGSTVLNVRSDGDKMIAIDYLGGGKAVEFHVLTWIVDNATEACFVSNDLAPCWGANVLALDPNEAEGGVNTSAISAGNNSINGKPITAGQFAEFGVNLALADIIPAGSCKTFNQTVWESRSSGASFVSSTKDIKIEDKAINNCASVSVTKVGSDNGSQEGAVFTLYNGTGTGGTVVGTCTVDSTGACVDANGDNPFTGLNPGTYTLGETGTPAGYGTDPLLLPDGYTFTLAIGDSLPLTFTDPLLSGAIVIAKTAKHADKSGNTSPNLVAGFTITDSGGAETTTSTDSDGAACVDGLPAGDATVSETGPPTGYSAGADQVVTVVGGTTCANADGVVASFVNTPLTDITVSVNSQVDGGTSSTISCDDPDATSGSTDANGDGSVTASDLEPGKYICTVVVDP